MALFSRNKKSTDTSTRDKQHTAPVTAIGTIAPTILRRPHLTEKAVRLGDHHVYTFLVHPGATKMSVKKAVMATYNVTPVKVNIVNKSPRTQMARAKGRPVAVRGYKKAYVYLKQDDTISLI